MIRGHRSFYRILFQLSDATTVFLSWMLAYYIRFVLKPEFLPKAHHQITLSQYMLLGLALVFVYYICFEIVGLYKRSIHRSLLGEIWTLSLGSLIGFMASVTGLHFLARSMFSRGALAIYLLSVVLAIILERIVIRFIIRRYLAKKVSPRNLLFVGNITRGENLYRKFKKRSDIRLNPVGIFSLESGESKDLQVFQGIESLNKIISEKEVSEIIICLSNKNSSRTSEILDLVSLENVHVRIVPDISQYALLGFEMEEFEGEPIVSVNQSPMVGWNAVLKRFTDILYSLAALLVFSPVLLIVSIIIKVTSKGPLLYKQERMGIDGQRFDMYKFRSMRVGAESSTGAVWAKENDDRTTWIGKILRKTSLDELPQLFNVLKGEMSCVGPRPERPVFVEKFRNEIPGYMLRHKVKAGMTGWAQINGFRGNTSLEGRINYDLYYITHWSIFFDFKIMFLTIFKGFISPNAY